MTEREQPLQVGRYLLHRKIARGGMATIHIARLMGELGFSRIVAAKRMHPELAEDGEFVAMFLDEARIASKVKHRNVVPVLDVVTLGEEVMLVQEYVHGAPLSVLLQNAVATNAHVPVPVAAAIACHVLAGLHAAHTSLDAFGQPLQIVHRDVSPQNVMIGTDGTARLLDFGVAKAAASAHVTRKGTFKGKLGYSAPEQIRGMATQQSDTYSLGVVLWELITGRRLHGNVAGEAQLIAQIMNGTPPTITETLAEEKSWIGSYRWSQLEAIEPIIRKALDANARRRWATAADMEEALTAAVPIAPASDIAAWLKAVGKDFLDERDRVLAEDEASWRRAGSVPPRLPSSPEVPTSTATEPHASPLETIRSALWRRGPTAALFVLVALLGASVAFLSRDLSHKAEAPPIAAQPPAPVAPTPSVAVAPTPAPPLPAAAVPLHPQPAVVEKTVVKVAATKSTTASVSQSPARNRAVRPSQTRYTPPAHTAAPSAPSKGTVTLDCTTPFYFEGRKKVFKAGCL